ncbi:sigma-54-dependent transcriptional regulator [Clostridium sp. ZBS13]|uniref:sigma-54-dependent transcriptional regulator n=1 Tax=Clostridium sp. ZBS13 TaxID=2949971 RepID=UPI00207AB7D2
MFDDDKAKDKLSRKERVYKKLKDLTQTINFSETLEEKIGFEASYIAKELNISRNNVSKELNCLVNEEMAVKIQGKPVLYLDKIYLQLKFGITIKESVITEYSSLSKMLKNEISLKKDEEFKDIKDIRVLEKEKEKLPKYKKTIFKSIIGSEDSLKSQIKQAKATILYPPNGLHTLLIGPTGVGKTTFAEAMYIYAIESGRFTKDYPYIIFNCADYAENSQLLLSHLFGHVKGAFTGASCEKKGLVDQANGGILFLDEVHRLSPEGQEMLFSLMDRGSYRRLGESENTRKANILFIAATTENPKSAILETFLRRIPVTINLPSLSKRSLKERMELICQFFKNESIKIKAPLKVSKEVLKVLLLYKCPGNIGQLKNDIQLICANAFVEYITEEYDYVYVKLSQISQRFKEGLFEIEDKRQELIKYFDLNDFESIIFNGSSEESDDNINRLLLYDDYNTEGDFYDLMLQKAQKFYADGLSIKQIRENIVNQIQYRFNNTSSIEKSEDLELDKEVLSKIVTPEIVQIIKESFIEDSGECIKNIDTKLIYSLALHIETLLERLRIGNIVIYPKSEDNYKDYKQEYGLATLIKSKIEEKFFVKIPNDELVFITMFLHSVNTKKEHGNIQVLVIAHGYGTATNMVDVAKTLLGYECIHALDMPLEEKVEVTLKKAIDTVSKIDKGSGVLLLVDMGSLATFGDVITEKTGIETRTIKMVSTPMVIEAARKAMTSNINMDILVNNIENVSSLIGGRVKVSTENIDSKNLELGSNYENMNWKKHIIKLLDEALTFLNVEKASEVLNQVLKKIAIDCDNKIDDSLYIKFLFHCSCMIERVIRNESLPYKKFLTIKNSKNKLFNIIKNNFELVEEIFGISIPDSELAYIVEMVDISFNITKN